MIYNAEKRDISIAVGGDAMITRRMRAFNEDRFLRLLDILHRADASVVNLEMLFHDYESSWQWSNATYTRSDPRTWTSSSGWASMPSPRPTTTPSTSQRAAS